VRGTRRPLHRREPQVERGILDEKINSPLNLRPLAALPENRQAGRINDLEFVEEITVIVDRARVNWERVQNAVRTIITRLLPSCRRTGRSGNTATFETRRNKCGK